MTRKELPFPNEWGVTTAGQEPPAPTLAPKSVAPPQGRTQRVKRERLGGTLDLAALKALREGK